MKPELHDKIAIYHPDVSIDGKNGAALAASLKASAAILKSLELVAVLLSLRNVKSIDESGISLLLSSLEELRKTIGADVGIIDYSAQWFNDIKTLIGKRDISLYKNFEVAHLLLNSKKHHRFDKAVVFDENEMFRQLLESELSAKGYKVVSANSRGEFEQLAKKNEYGTIYISDTHLDLMQNFIPTKILKGVVLYDMQSEADVKFINHFNFLAHQSRIKDGYKLFVFDAKELTKLNPKVIDFLISLSLQGQKFESKIILLGASVQILPKPLRAKLEQAGIGSIESMETVFSDSKYKALRKEEKSKGLTKKLVSSLPIFIDASLETFETLVGAKATKKSHKINKYKIENRESLVAASLSFEGELDGVLVLVFNESIARKASESLLGDANVSFEELLDAISEFSNIIGGRAKALLAERDTHITIAIPKTFDNKEALSKFLAEKDGVQIDLELNGDPIVMFLTY